MNISLPQSQEEFEREQAESGLYESSSEVHSEALRLLMEKRAHYSLRDDLRAAVDIGIAEADQGEAKACTPDDIIQLSKVRRERARVSS